MAEGTADQPPTKPEQKDLPLGKWRFGADQPSFGRFCKKLNKAIATDLAAHELTSETAGLEELFQAVESLYQRVADLLKDHEA